VALLGLLVASAGCAGKTTGAGAPLSEDEAVAMAVDAYVYGYPLVTMEMTRRVMTNTATPGDKHAPMGQFAIMRSYPDAAYRDVTAPNADTLYTVAWLDLSKEPYVLSLPDEKGRYYLMPMLSAWTDVFADPGKRTTGTGPQTYAITGPGWKGTLPQGVKEIKSPTNMVWILGRTYCSGTPQDYAAVHALQDKYALVPLSAYGNPYTPPQGKVDPSIDMKTPVRDQVNALPVGTYFAMMAKLMKDNPPAEADAPMVARMARLGIVPGREFDMSRLSPSVAKRLEGVPKAAAQRLAAFERKAAKIENGWMVPTNLGVYGANYDLRALITYIGLGANRPADAIYPMYMGEPGEKLTGAKKYVMHFDKGKLPPVNGFWSLTMYDQNFFFVDNPLNRYTLSQRDKLRFNADGSVDLYIQHENPGKARQSNWLPAPAGEFNLMLRLYWPKDTPPSILDGSWSPPPVKVAR
jgi:hypothetical protein